MIVKRVFDLFFSAVGMFILSPVFLVVAILIKIDSKGPIYFRQDRVGKNNEVFQIHKFRTMEINTPSNKNILENKNQNDFKSKTTNVNISLNRVRIEKKNNLKKKIIFTSIITILLGLTTIIVVV